VTAHHGHVPLRDHWWPRPGWRPGRIALTWHVIFPDSAPLARHVAAYQRALDVLPGVDPVPAEWLHLTVQAIGWADEVPAATVSAVVDAVRARVSTLAPFDLVFHRPTIYGEAAAIRSHPHAPVVRLREAVRAGLHDVLGDDGVPTAPEQARGFLPHVTVAYSRVDADVGPYAAALAGVVRPPTTVPVSEVTLIRQERLLAPHWQYRWTVEAVARLGAPPSASAGHQGESLCQQLDL
jgi:2'-5' RNA ligase